MSVLVDLYHNHSDAENRVGEEANTSCDVAEGIQILGPLPLFTILLALLLTPLGIRVLYRIMVPQLFLYFSFFLCLFVFSIGQSLRLLESLSDAEHRHDEND